MWIFLFLPYSHIIYWLSTNWCNAPASQNLLILSTSVSVPNHCCIFTPAQYCASYPHRKRNASNTFQVFEYTVFTKKFVKMSLEFRSHSVLGGRQVGVLAAVARSAVLSFALDCRTVAAASSCRVLSLTLFWPSFRYLWPSIINIDSRA